MLDIAAGLDIEVAVGGDHHLFRLRGGGEQRDKGKGETLHRELLSAKADKKA